MSDDTYAPNELYRLENVALDVARNYGNESTLMLAKIKRVINRAAILVAGHDRKWSWMLKNDSFNTVSEKETYSLAQDARDVLHFWKGGENRGKISRIGAQQFRDYVPDATVYSGVPSMWDEQGVDTNGAKVISLFPIPNGVYEVNYRFFRHLLPVRNDQNNLWAYWGMPPNIIEGCLIPMATALLYKGIDDDRYKLERGEAEAQIELAYGADQQKANTRIRIPAMDPELNFVDGPLLPPEYGY